MNLKEKIREIPDWSEKGVNFKDIIFKIPKDNFCKQCRSLARRRGLMYNENSFTFFSGGQKGADIALSPYTYLSCFLKVYQDK